MLLPQHRRRLAFRAAADIHERLLGSREAVPPIGLPEDAWRECGRLIALAAKADRHGWRHARRALRRDLEAPLRQLGVALDAALRQLRAQASEPPPATLPDLHGDLLALDDEFERVTIDLGRRTLVVTTAPIVLADVPLGPFEVRWDWGRPDDPASYEVVALDARAAAADGDVTHPHVQGERLCAGDARQPIRRALRAGRVFDFFVLVDRVLHTYNPASAFVDLEHWDDGGCEGCGAIVPERDLEHCAACGSGNCSDCSVSCPACTDGHCLDCLEECRGCEQRHCTACLARCALCGDPFCESCLTDSNCEDCRAETANEDRNEDRRSPAAGGLRDAAAPDGAVHAVCVGEARLSPRPG